jgi:hypothetical protein
MLFLLTNNHQKESHALVRVCNLNLSVCCSLSPALRDVPQALAVQNCSNSCFGFFLAQTEFGLYVVFTKSDFSSFLAQKSSKKCIL